MTQPIFSTTSTPSPAEDDNRIYHDFPNWFPKYERNVYEWNTNDYYMHGDFVVTTRSDWSDINGNHKDAEKIVWMCIMPELCSV